MKDLDKKYIANTYSRYPISLIKGKGSKVYDDEDKEYIDLTSGIAVNTFGFQDDIWCKAVKKQIDKLQHVSNLYYTEPCIYLAKMLCEKTGFKKVFFSNSGAEANECAIKAARKYSQDKYTKERYKIVTLNGSFHGRTMATLSATGQDYFHKDFNPMLPGFLYSNINDIESIDKIVSENDDIAAFMIELIQGEGGLSTLDIDYVKHLEKISKEKDILLIIDEVQTGNGRTGALYAYMNYGIKPDIITTAKGLAGGLPLGACLFNDKTENVLSYGTHGSTFGANPIASAGALSILERLDLEVFKGVKQREALIKEELKDAKGLLAISGKGLMLGLLVEKNVDDIILECMKRGVLILKAKDKIRLLPALNIPLDELKYAIKIIKECL